jgi:hypothetical protein
MIALCFNEICSLSSRFRSRWQLWFVGSTFCLLVATGVVKIVSALSEVKLLGAPDPLFGFLSNRQVAFLAGVAELAVAWFIGSNQSLSRKAGVLAWLCVCLLAYRGGLWLVGFNGFCGCLGNMSSWLNTDPAIVERLADAFLVYMCLGTTTVLVSDQPFFGLFRNVPVVFHWLGYRSRPPR